MPFPTLGRYVVESKLGEGGMGVGATAPATRQLSRTVAIKVLPPDHVVDADRKRRFFQEARAASALNHPNIVTIYDVGSDGDTDFIVMEYVDRLDARSAAAAARPAGEAGAAIAVAIADALAKAHEAGIVHRDLKPSNVMITDDGAVKVLDFGVAKLLEAADGSGDDSDASLATGDRHRRGHARATCRRSRPTAARVDARSDIFSFGVVLYEMVTGRRAFSGASPLSVLAKILNDEPTPPSQLTPTVPRSWRRRFCAACGRIRRGAIRRWPT